MEAEEEKIVEHVKEAFHALADKKKGWKEKIGSFLWEILIIIIAVNLTIWFHSWSDKRHERQLEKEFLIDIKESLVEDTISIRNYINFMNNNILVYYDSALAQVNNNKIDAQYIDSLFWKLTQDFGIAINNGIYQSFSSANNLRLIENKRLLSDIIYTYTNTFPNIDFNLKFLFNKRNDAFEKYIALKTGYDNNGSTKLSTIIHQPEIIFVFQMGQALIKGINNNFENSIVQVDTLIQEINQELKDKFNYDTSKHG